MERSILDQFTDNLEEQLANYQDLTAKYLSLEQRLVKAKGAKGTVKDRIYDRVLAEYKKQARAIKDELAPLEEMIEKARDDIANHMQEIDSQRVDIQDRREELKFRHSVGEFDEERLAELDEPLKDEAEEIERRRARLIEQAQRFDAPKTEGPAPKAARSSGTPSKPPKDGESPRPKQPEEKSMDGLVNPSSWMNELDDAKTPDNGDRVRTEAPATPRDLETDDDPLAMLADASDDRSGGEAQEPEDEEPKPVPEKRTRSSSGVPRLVIMKGGQPGRRIPLLPMTMTIGREHDNNIELKDEDVARYHARISFQRGEYVLQDLESSTGTWVNDLRVTEVRLKHEDAIRMGGTEMLITFDSAE